jgi:thiol-disulfide isomerase/thioredoxin
MRFVVLMMVGCCLSFGARGEEGESKEIQRIQDLLREARPKKDKNGDEDIEKRREAAVAAAGAAATFLKEHPDAKEAMDVRFKLNQALMHAALCGDTNSVIQLRELVGRVSGSPDLPADLKENTVIMNHYVEWGLKNGKRFVDEVSLEGRPIYVESLFAAADQLPEKESILQRILLEARSGFKLKESDAKGFAERVLKHPGATEFLKTAARKFLAGGKEYEIGKTLELEFTAMDGRKVDLKELRGKVVLIDFWATWCGPCVADFPKLKKTYETWHAKGLEVIGINLDDEEKDLVSFLKKNGPAPWPQYFDGKGWNTAVSWRFGINSVPSVWVVDKKGVLRSTNAYYDTNDMFYVEDYLKAPE